MSDQREALQRSLETIDRIYDMSKAYEPVHELKQWLRKNQQHGVVMKQYQNRIEFTVDGKPYGRRYGVVTNGQDLRGHYSGGTMQMVQHSDYPYPLIVAMEYPVHEEGLRIIQKCTSMEHANYVWGLLREAIMQQYQMHDAFVTVDMRIRAAGDSAAVWRNHMYKTMEREAQDGT